MRLWHRFLELIGRRTALRLTLITTLDDITERTHPTVTSVTDPAEIPIVLLDSDVEKPLPIETGPPPVHRPKIPSRRIRFVLLLTPAELHQYARIADRDKITPMQAIRVQLGFPKDPR